MCRHSASRLIPYLAAMLSRLAPAILVASMRARSGCLQTVQVGPFLDLSLGRTVEVRAPRLSAGLWMPWASGPDCELMKVGCKCLHQETRWRSRARLNLYAKICCDQVNVKAKGGDPPFDPP
jgi:hypothetical protein